MNDAKVKSITMNGLVGCSFISETMSKKKLKNLNEYKMEDKYEEFQKELESLLNKMSMENISNTPDFILANYLTNCLRTFDVLTEKRDMWRSADSNPETE